MARNDTSEQLSTILVWHAMARVYVRRICVRYLLIGVLQQIQKTSSENPRTGRHVKDVFIAYMHVPGTYVCRVWTMNTRWGGGRQETSNLLSRLRLWRLPYKTSYQVGVPAKQYYTEIWTKKRGTQYGGQRKLQNATIWWLSWRRTFVWFHPWDSRTDERGGSMSAFCTSN